MLKIADPVHVDATDRPSVDLGTVMTSIEDRLPVIETMDRGARPLLVGSLYALLTDALIYLKRYETLRRDLTPRDHGEG